MPLMLNCSTVMSELNMSRCGGVAGAGEGGRGGGGWGGDDGRGGLLGVQQGPVHCVNLFLSLAFLSLLHLMCSHCKQLEHCTEVAFTGMLQTEQGQGPGFGSMPAISKSSLIRLAGRV